ncbi:tubulin--tyrosine ligase-like protein 12 [Pseudoliparis swirei]|uniref:tubulin--tyrosine ligase-like protein 12 n=1 Tax=Pseudoliparis swirei TaxID=2059687 RepID=UPI0024BE4D95|nr:tubulin--tyrosine ligase-like protein 12 [Pseudoliparis swirei]
MHLEEEEEEEEEEGGGHAERKSPAVRCKVLVTREAGLQASEPTSVYLVDHAWTYRVRGARQQLEETPGLLPRMAALVGAELHGEGAELHGEDPETLELVMQRMWKYNQTYKLSQGPPEAREPVWYLLDEFGSGLQHSDRPSCSMAPFLYAPGGPAYSVLWALEDLQEGDEATRDYTYGETDPLVRRCRLLPWIPDPLVTWCSQNNLELNALKTVEMVVDFRRNAAPPAPLILCDSPVDAVESYRFLGSIISQDLKWELNIGSITKKAQQRMFFLRQLRKFNLPGRMMVQFYTAIVESIICSSITVWHPAATAKDKCSCRASSARPRGLSAAICLPSRSCSLPGH